MSTYSKFLSLINGLDRTVDLSSTSNTLGVSGLELIGSSSGYVTMKSSATVVSPYTLIWPSAQAATAGYVLANDGTGQLSWAAPAATGANYALSNLASVAINTSLLPGPTNGSVVLGSGSNYFGPSYINQLLDSAGNESVNAFSRFLSDSSGNAQLSWSTSGISIGVDNSVAGKLNIANGTSNAHVAILASAVTTSYNFNLPATAGSSGQVLVSGGGGSNAMTWASAATGTVTSVTFTGDGTVLSSTPSSAVTSSGTLTATLNSQAAGSVLAGPVNGSAAAPTFRSLVVTDIPSLSAVYVTQSEVGTPNGVASLDPSGKIPASQLPSNVFIYQGTWNPNTNTPTLADGTGTAGYVYWVSAAYSGTVSGLNNASMTNFQIGDLVLYNGTQWELTTPAAGVTSVNGAQGAVTVNAINQLTGDVTAGPASGSASAASTISAGAVTLAKMANLAANSIIGNNTGSAATPLALSGAQVTAMLSLFSTSSTTQGLVPGSNGASSSFLRGDGTWATPSGTGVTSISVVSANGFAGSSSGGSTPALTISTTITGLLKGNGTAISAATAGTDYVIPSGSITGTAANVTATSNSTLATLSALTTIGLSTAGIVRSTSGGALSSAELSGDATTSGNNVVSVVRINGGSIPSAKTIVGTNSSGQIIDASSAALSNNTSGSAGSVSGTNVITASNMSTGAFDQVTITGGNGVAASVQYAPALKRVLVAGQNFSANTSYVVRWGIAANGETQTRVYVADITTSSFDLFYVIGIASSSSAVSAGGNIAVTTLGSFSLSSGDTAFASNTAGLPVFLSSSGAFSTTAPSSSGQAIVRIGTIQAQSSTAASNIIDVNIGVVGVN